LLDHIALQLDREEIKGREDGKRSKEGDYLREAINQGTGLLLLYFRGNTVYPFSDIIFLSA